MRTHAQGGSGDVACITTLSVTTACTCRNSTIVIRWSPRRADVNNVYATLSRADLTSPIDDPPFDDLVGGFGVNVAGLEVFHTGPLLS